MKDFIIGLLEGFTETFKLLLSIPAMLFLCIGEADWDSVGYFVGIFIAGAVMVVGGLFLIYRR